MHEKDECEAMGSFPRMKGEALRSVLSWIGFALPRIGARRLAVLLFAMLSLSESSDCLAAVKLQRPLFLEEMVLRAKRIVTGRFVKLVEIHGWHWQATLRIDETWKGESDPQELVVTITNHGSDGMFQPIFGRKIIVFLEQLNNSDWVIVEGGGGQVEINGMGAAVVRASGVLLPILFNQRTTMALNSESGLQFIEIETFKRMVLEFVDYRYSIRSLVEQSSMVAIGRLHEKKFWGPEQTTSQIVFDLEIQEVWRSDGGVQSGSKLLARVVPSLPREALPIRDGGLYVLFLGPELGDGSRAVLASGRGQMSVIEHEGKSLALLWRGGLDLGTDVLGKIDFDTPEVNVRQRDMVGSLELDYLRREVERSAR